MVFHCPSRLSYTDAKEVRNTLLIPRPQSDSLTAYE